jgi:hypothetical protein
MKHCSTPPSAVIRSVSKSSDELRLKANKLSEGHNETGGLNRIRIPDLIELNDRIGLTLHLLVFRGYDFVICDRVFSLLVE